jgi:hypothetical protein
MNERIKELVKRAGGHISIRNLASNPVQHIESVELWDDRIEKFTKLIVEECAAELIRWKNEPFPYDPEFGARLIKEHFGVKE